MSDENESVRRFIRLLVLVQEKIIEIRARLVNRPGIREVMDNFDPTIYGVKGYGHDLARGKESACLYLDVDTEKPLLGGQSALGLHFCLEWEGSDWAASWAIGWGGGNSPWLTVEENELRSTSIHEIAAKIPGLAERMTGLFWKTLDEHLEMKSPDR